MLKNQIGYQPIVTKALDGFNGTIFAYGQTGSGIPKINDLELLKVHMLTQYSRRENIFYDGNRRAERNYTAAE